MQNPREIRGSKWSKGVYFERILVRIVRVWARLSSFSSNPRSKAVQNDHIRQRGCRKTARKWAFERCRLLQEPTVTGSTRAPASTGIGGAGIVTRKMLPTPGVLSTAIEPL